MHERKCCVRERSRIGTRIHATLCGRIVGIGRSEKAVKGKACSRRVIGCPGVSEPPSRNGLLACTDGTECLNFRRVNISVMVVMQPVMRKI